MKEHQESPVNIPLRERITNSITKNVIRPAGKGILLLLADAVYLDHNQHRQVTDEIKKL